MSPADELPRELADLFAAADESTTERAWKRFLDQYSRLILHTLRRLSGDYDTVMDRYSFVLEHLRHDQYRRLRAFSPKLNCKFTTWLVVVVRRLGLDHHRRRYGTTGSGSGSNPATSAEEQSRAVRRRLADLVAEHVDVAELSALDAEGADFALRASELHGALDRAVEALIPRDRLLLRLRFEQDLSARQIAALMGFPTPFHVYRRCNRICEALRAELVRRGVADPSP